MPDDGERPYISLGDTDRPWSEEHHDAVQLLVIDTLRNFTGAILNAANKAAHVHEMLVSEQILEKAYFTSLGGQLRLMGPGEAADCMGVTTQRLHTLRKRAEFPRPVADLACGPIWLARDIEQFQATRKRTPGPAKKDRTEE